MALLRAAIPGRCVRWLDCLQHTSQRCGYGGVRSHAIYSVQGVSARRHFSSVGVHGIHAIVAGSTGGVGRSVVSTLAKDPRVSRITALARRDGLDAATLFQLGDVPQVAHKIEFAAVDYETLISDPASYTTVFQVHSATECIAALALILLRGLQGHDVGFSGLGIYTKDARNEEHFRRVEIAYNVAFARALVAGGGSRLAYLSGAGAKAGGMFMFARVKADAERSLREVQGIARSSSMRPGFITARPGAINDLQERVGTVLAPFLVRVGQAVSAENIAKAMAHVTLPEARPADVATQEQDVLENNDIVVAAQSYDLLLQRLVAESERGSA